MARFAVGLSLVLSVASITLDLTAQSTPGDSPRHCKLHCDPPSPKVYRPENDRKSGDILRGPRTIVAADVNTLRYEYVFNSAAAYQKAPDVWATLSGMPLTLPSNAPAVTPKAQPPTQPSKGPGRAAYPPQVQALLDRFSNMQGSDEERFNVLDQNTLVIVGEQVSLGRLQRTANSAIANVTLASSNLSAFVSNTTGIADELIPATKRESADSIFRSGLTTQWPSFDEIATVQNVASAMKSALAAFKTLYDPFIPKQTAALALLKQDCQTTIDTLKKQKKNDQSSITALENVVQGITSETTALTDNATLLQWQSSQIDATLAGLPDLLSDSSKYVSFVKNQAILENWDVRMTEIVQNYDAYAADHAKHNPLYRETRADCEFSFGGGKTTTVTLSRKDLLPGSDPKNSETVLSVTVQCTSPLSISAGVAFDTIGENTFGIQPVAKGQSTQNVFAITSQSSFHPVPLGMAHARLCEFGNTASLHFSFGVGAGIKSQDAGGSAAEFLVGPSLALFRSVFLTPGLYLGQTASLSGFKVGDPVPSGVTSPPLKTSYTPGFGFAITFTKP